MQNLLVRLLSICLIFSLQMSTVSAVVNAAMVDTQAALSLEHRVERIDEISRWLLRDEVSTQLTHLGVDVDEARKRVETMTDAELRQLDRRINDLPAGGGVLEVIGIVFVVLIILELLGVTNVFSRM